jgi:hypothetical protein
LFGLVALKKTAGSILRRNDQFTALDQEKVIREAAESAAGLKARAKWPA